MKASSGKSKKRPSTKRKSETVWKSDEWLVNRGRLVPLPGRPPKTSHLFEMVAEKLPYECLLAIKKYLNEDGDAVQGVYLAHDSMGVARYGGRGNIFNRLADHKRKYSTQLQYFSFYVVANKAHEREIETAILRAAGPQMTLNTRKVASGVLPGDIRDYEPGTIFFERRDRG